ncbi:MAG: hypothetical protein U1E23_02660 [Reyranellaceae bacterium]
MTIRSMKWAGGVSLAAAVLALGTALPAGSASAQVTAVPREGVAFNDQITQRVKIETVDPEERTVAFTQPSGRLLVLPVANGVGNLASIDDGSYATVTFTQIVTVLNLRQKGPGSKEARREAMSGTPDAADIDSGRFTLTVVGVDLANNTVAVISGNGGEVHTYRANTIAKQDMLKKIKVGDVVIGMTTPLMVTAISPAR